MVESAARAGILAAAEMATATWPPCNSENCLPVRHCGLHALLSSCLLIIPLSKSKSESENFIDPLGILQFDQC